MFDEIEHLWNMGRVYDLKPHFKIKYEFGGNFMGEFIDETDKIDIKIDDKIVQTFTIKDYNNSNKIDFLYEAEHHGNSLKLDIICRTNLSPPRKGCEIFKSKLTIFKC